MDSNNEQVPKPDQVIGGEAVPSGDWRTQLPQDSRERIVKKIMETLKRHLPFVGQEGLSELKKIAVRFEEKIYTAAASQSDYLRKISLKMLTMETKSQNPMANPLQSNAASASNSENPQDPASQSMQSQMQSLVQQLPIPMVPNCQQILSPNIQNNIPSAGVPISAGLTPAMPPIGGMSQGTMHQQQSTGQQNNLPNMHQQQSGGQTNLSFLQQQKGGIHHGNSSLQTNPQPAHMVQQSKVAVQQQMQQKMANMLPNQAQPSQSQPMQQQSMSKIQSQPGQLEHQLGSQQQSNTLNAYSSSQMGSATRVDWHRKQQEQQQLLLQQYMLRQQQQQQLMLQQYMQPLVQQQPQQLMMQQPLIQQLQQQQLVLEMRSLRVQLQQQLMLQKPLIQQQQQQPMLQKPVIQLQQQTSKQPLIQQQQTLQQQDMLKQPLIQQQEQFRRLPGQKMMPTKICVLVIYVVLLLVLMMMLHCGGVIAMVR